MSEHSPTPWEVVETTEHHGPYIITTWGTTICDLYAMSNPMAASVRNGGESYPVHFTDADANAAFIVGATNHFDDLVACVRSAMNMVDGDGTPPDWDFLRTTLKSAETQNG